MKSKDLKSLCETIATTVEATQPKQLAEGYINSLTEKARQVYSSINEEKDEDEDEKEESPAEEKAEDKAEMLMKRLAAKALKRARKKAATNEQTEKASSINQPIKRNPLAKPKIKKPPHDSPKPSGHYVKEEETHLAEKAAPGYENWASDPKVKASFKKQYGKDWKQVMYGRSWNMKKMDEEIQLEEGIVGNIVSGVKNIFSKSKKKPLPPLPPGGRRLSSRSRPGAKPRKLSESEQLDEEIQLEEGVKRMRRLRSAYARGRGSRKLTDTYDKELSKVSASRLRRGGASKQTIRGFFTDKPTTAAADKAYSKFSKDAMAKASAKGKKVFESEQLAEISDTLLFRARAKAKGVGKFKVRTNSSFAGSSKDVPLHKKITKELQRRGSVPVSESEQLDELSNQLLHRAKYAAWVKRKLSKKTGEALDKKFNRELLRRGDVHADRPRERRRSRSSEDWMNEDVQLDEAGYKRLGRIKAAAYKAELASRGADPNTSMNALMKTSKLKRAAAEREAQVAAGMARRGGASPEAVKGGGSRIGKSGKYTQKAGALANQRDKALAKFRARTGYNKAQGMSRSSTEKQISRNTQQFQDDIRNRSRSGDFGQDNQAALRARSNFQKRYGRLKGK